MQRTELTREELESSVPVHQERQSHGTIRFIRLIDVPNPYRSECWHDHRGSNLPKRWCLRSMDWQIWLGARFSGSYKPRHKPDAPFITDEMIRGDVENRGN
ncbi:MAG TPA: hypothetical protein VJ654_11300 [Noviherbaspirillum sp.]|nr:hypothetical protein [Noviherbaspirillum sp.]